MGATESVPSKHSSRGSRWPEHMSSTSGGGDGSFVAELGIDFARLVLIDVSPDMLGLAEDFIEREKLTTLCGSEEMMGELADESVDLILCINAINYLEAESQARFFAESHRVLRSGGHLLAMTGNELLDLFSLNSGTAEFFEKNFGSDVAHLLVSGSEERWVNAGRFNPLSFGAVVAKYGFRELKQAYSQWHEVPPGLAALSAKGDLPAARLAARNHALNPNELPNESGWQALFRCSMFASLCRKA